MDQHTQAPREIAPGAVLAPPPSWVDAEPYPIPAEADPHFIAHGICLLLEESQVDLCGPERAWYFRRANLVTAAAGAEQAAQFSVTYDPAFERVEIHGITVIRRGERIEHAANAFYEVLRRERNMERLQFDGRLTAHVTIPDVRAGDVVETAYTRYGGRKTLGGRHARWMPFDWGVGIVDLRIRQRAPCARVIHERAFGDAPPATEQVDGEIVDRRWRALERPAHRFEALTPPWVVQGAFLQWSEWKDWAEVAAAFASLYEHAGPLPDMVQAELQRIQAQEKTPADKAAALLRFAQGDVRYLAISMGEGGYTPRDLNEICTTRYGDCKDKSKLFVAMARELGLDACPALVSTREGYLLNDWLPSGELFDHCIVRLEIKKKVYWIDPTRHVQPSPLDKLSQCHFGWALPLRPGAAALERMADPPLVHLIETHENVTLGGKLSIPVRYEWEHKFREGRAEVTRDHFAREGSVGVFKAYANDVQRVWPKARVVSQELVSDDVANNIMVVREVYEIDEAWEKLTDTEYRFQTLDRSITGSLAPLDPGERQHPIYLGPPGRFSRHVDVRMAMKHNGGWSRRFGNDGLSLNNELRAVDPTWLVLEQILVIGGLTLKSNEVEAYRAVVAGIGQNDLVIHEKVHGNKFSKSNSGGGGGWGWLWWIWIALVLLGAIARIGAPY